MSEFEKIETVKGINKLLNQLGSPVADGFATSYTTKFPSGKVMEFYRDNVGMWVQKIVDGAVVFDSRGYVWQQGGA